MQKKNSAMVMMMLNLKVFVMIKASFLCGVCSRLRQKVDFWVAGAGAMKIDLYVARTGVMKIDLCVAGAGAMKIDLCVAGANATKIDFEKFIRQRSRYDYDRPLYI